MSLKRHQFAMWTMWFIASFFYAYQYILRVLPNIMMFDIIEKFHINASIFGQYSGLYYIGYAAMHLPIGIMLDKYGPKRILPLCILLTIAGLLPLIYSEHWLYPSLGRLLIGMGSSAAILGVFKIIRIAFAEHKFTVMLGFSVTIGLLGAIYGGQPVNYLMQEFGWIPVIKILIWIGIALAVISFFVIPTQPRDLQPLSWWTSIKSVLSNRRIISICILAGLMVGPLEGFADVWGKEYLKSAYRLSENMAATLPSLIFFGMCFGSPVLSWIAAKSNRYYGMLVLSALIMGSAFLLLLSGYAPIISLSALFVMVGIFCAYQIIAIYLASTYVEEHLVGLTTACANMIIMIFGYIFHSIIGKIIALSWNGAQTAQGTPIYSAYNYTLALTVIPIGLLIAMIGFILLIKTRPRINAKA